MTVAEVHAAGTFESPLPAGQSCCPACGEETLRRVEYGLLEYALGGMLKPKDAAEFKRRIEVRCPCGFAGSAWRASA
jgi:hypothetical protein